MGHRHATPADHQAHELRMRWHLIVHFKPRYLFECKFALADVAAQGRRSR